MGVEFCKMLSLYLLELCDFFIKFVNMVYHIDWFAYIETIYCAYIVIKPIWSWCMILFMCFWIRFATILLRIFAFYIHQWYWPVILLVCVCGNFVWFWYQGNGGLIEWVWEFSSSAIFWKNLRKIGVSSSLSLWYNTCEGIWP